MEQITITAKVQIVVSDTDKVVLNKTMNVYRDACNYVSDYVFRTHDLKQFSINKVLYSTLRKKFGLKSQKNRAGSFHPLGCGEECDILTPYPFCLYYDFF